MEKDRWWCHSSQMVGERMELASAREVFTQGKSTEKALKKHW
jgi:hypothetical protein